MRQLLVKRALEYLDSLATEAGAAAEAAAGFDASSTRAPRALALAHSKLGEVLTATGEKRRGLASHGTALAPREALAAADPQTAGHRLDLAGAENKLRAVLMALPDLPGALKIYASAAAVGERLAGGGPKDMEARRALVAAYEGLGHAEAALAVAAPSKGADGAARARAAFRRCLALVEEIRAAAPDEAGSLGRDLDTCRSGFGPPKRRPPGAPGGG